MPAYSHSDDGKYTNAFSDIYKRKKTREEYPDIYNPKTPIKDTIKLIVVLITALMFPIVGIIYYGIWRDDNTKLARTGLFGFWINFIYMTSIVLMPFFLFWHQVVI